MSLPQTLSQAISSGQTHEFIPIDCLDTAMDDNHVAQLRQKLATSIRRRVEYYFSNDNLQADGFLWWKMSGSSNLPVPVETIRRFSEMRGYHDLSLILDALKDSTSVKLVQIDGIWHFQRKMTFPTEAEEAALKRKPRDAARKAEWFHKQGFSMAKVKQSKPTGFEDYYADAPITFDDFKQEQDLYSLDHSVFTRIETAVQRYSRRRNFTTAFRQVFDKWMSFGGITSGPKEFIGTDKAALEDMTTRQIREVMATSFISEDALDEAKMVLDFERVIKAFLSCVVPDNWDISDPVKRARCINVPRNFLNYLLYHDAIPEHREAIVAARTVCDQAEAEFPRIMRAARLLPGSFNTACSVLFGGQHAGKKECLDSWADEYNTGTASDTVERMTLEDAKTVYEAAVGRFSPRAIIDTGMSPELKPPFRQNAGLEVLSIVRPHPSSAQTCKTLLGRVTCRPWTIPEFAANDLPPNIIGTPSDPSEAAKLAAATETYDFLVEDAVLSDCCFVGMKFEADIYRVLGKTRWPVFSTGPNTAGIEPTASVNACYFFGNVRQVLPAFYEAIENELNMPGRFAGKWREPRVISKEEHEARDAWIAGRGIPDETVAGKSEHMHRENDTE